MKRKCSLALLFIGISFIVNAQQVRPVTSGELYSEIVQLRHLVSVLYVAAHPDDENTRLLAYLVNERHIRTGYLSLTRGDGGQNLLGSEQGAALGLIRTHELMEARKLDGAEQFFSRAVDFGYSKNSDETFKHWSKEILAGDAVKAMRRFRPDVVICRFPPDSNAGHGQHAASAIIAKEAFYAAGDKTKYPEQLILYPAWQPKRLLFNAFRFGSRNTTSEDQYKEQVGQYVPWLGCGVGELAGRSRSVHKSQGAGTPSVPGTQLEYFKLTAGIDFTESLFDGIDTSWGRVDRQDIGDDLLKIAQDYDFMHPDASIPALLAVKKKIATVKDKFWKEQKTKEINDVIMHCAGFMAELYVRRAEAVRGEELPFTLNVIARSETPVVLKNIKWGQGDSSLSVNISGDSLHSFAHNMAIPASAPVTQPYWLSKKKPYEAMYYMPSDYVGGLPETPSALNATLTLTVGGAQFEVEVPWSYKRLDPVKGDVVEQLRIVPDATIEFANTLLIADADGSVHADLHIHAYKNLENIGAGINLDLDGSATKLYEISGLTFKSGADTIVPVVIPAGKVRFGIDGSASLVPELSVADAGALQIIEYSHLPTLQLFSNSSAEVLKPDWKCTAKKIGYVEGAGDYIPSMLRLLGMDVDMLKDEDFTDPEALSKYDAIVTGVRVVNAEKRMAYWMPALLRYAEQGGTLLMQYNTYHNMATKDLGPYPFKLSYDRVTEEDAKVTFLKPEHRLLNYPNKITQDDFKGWVQERGLYFPSEWDDKYTALFSMHDSGEKPVLGSTLYTKTGKGNYIYAPISFFRQLPAGNAGAIRLMMNMLSVGK